MPAPLWWCHNPEGHPGRRSSCAGGAAWGAAPAWTHAGAGGRLEEEAPATDRERCVRCGGCVDACPTEARRANPGRTLTVDEVLAEVERDRPFYLESQGGMTVSGGEPLHQPEFLLALLREARARDLHTALDTSGYAPWAALDRVRPFVDLFLYDLKLVDDTRHRRVHRRRQRADPGEPAGAVGRGPPDRTAAAGPAGDQRRRREHPPCRRVRRVAAALGGDPSTAVSWECGG